MRILAIESALSEPSAALLEGARILALCTGPVGSIARLAQLVRSVLQEAGLEQGDLDAVAACVGPGSFTGIRAGLALAHGIGLAARVPVIGVSVGEALAAAMAPSPGRPLWVVIESRRAGAVYLERGGEAASFAPEMLPLPAGPIALAGDAAARIQPTLARRGADVELARIAVPDAAAVGRAALARSEGRLGPRDAMPLYVDPPAARVPAPCRRPLA